MSWIRSIWSSTEEARNSLNQQTIFIYTLALSLPSGQQNHFLCQLKCSTRDDWSVFRPGCGRLSGDITWPETSDAMTAIRKKLSSSSLSLRRESCCWLGRQTRLKIDYMVVVGSGNIKFFPSRRGWTVVEYRSFITSTVVLLAWNGSDRQVPIQSDCII